MIEIALYQPDIAPNAATILRMAACLGLTVRIIEPAGFTWSDSSFRRAGLDYLDQVKVVRDASWEGYRTATSSRRTILLTTKAAIPYLDFSFNASDIILAGRETSGVPAHIHEAVEARLLIPMKPGLRSLNVAVACAMVTGEALRQTGGFLAPPNAKS
jgi:tRNA (cytidine/uridine-2'-O-)-methyltransferase